MRIARKGLAAMFAAIIGVGAAVSPALSQTTTQLLSGESVIETIKERGAIKVGMSLVKPWAMRDLNGDLVGFEIDVARKLAEDMGVEIEFVPTPWDGLIPGLVSGKSDVIISGMSIKASRNLTVNFTEPYAFSGLEMYANNELTNGFTLEDFNNADVTFVAIRGGVAEGVISRMFPNAKILLFDDDGATQQEVLNGNAHAGMAARPNPTLLAERYPETVHIPFDRLFQPSGEAFAIRKSDIDGLNFFNNWIAANWRNDWLNERHKYWFGGKDWQDQVAD